MIHVIATITVKSGRRADFLVEFNKVVAPTRAETGCIEYGASVDVKTTIPVQGEVRPDVVVVIEKWASVDALMAHLQAPHMLEYRTRVAELVENLNLQVLQPAS